MTKSENKKANELYRNAMTQKLMQFFKSADGGEERVIQVANNAFGFPFVDSLGKNKVVKITVSIPTGDRDGNFYDLDIEGECYQILAKAKSEISRKKKETVMIQ